MGASECTSRNYCCTLQWHLVPVIVVGVVVFLFLFFCLLFLFLFRFFLGGGWIDQYFFYIAIINLRGVLCYKKQELPALFGCLGSPCLWWGQCYSVSSFMCMFCRSLYVILSFFLLIIVLYALLRLRDCSYLFSIFKPFLLIFLVLSVVVFCVVFVLVFVMCLVYPMLPVSMDCPFLIATSFGFI